MRYRVHSDLAFEDQDVAELVYNYLHRKLADVKPIISHQDAEDDVSEGASVWLELCRHDEGKPCELLKEEKIEGR